MSKEGFRTPAGAAGSRRLGCSFWARMPVFPESQSHSSCRRLIWNLQWLSTEASLHKKRTALDNLRDKRGRDVLHHVGAISDHQPLFPQLEQRPSSVASPPGSSFPSPCAPICPGELSYPFQSSAAPAHTNQDAFLLLRRHFQVASF